MSNDSSQISEREREILRLVATGATNQQIAYQLNISVNTVKVHLRNIFGKIGVASRTEATVFAVRSGLVQLSEAASEAGVVPPTAVAETLPDEAEPLLAQLDDADVFADTPETAHEWTAVPIRPVVAPAAPAPVAKGRFWLLGGVLLAALLIAGAVALYITRNNTIAPATSTAVSSSTDQPTVDTQTRWRTLAPMPSGRAGFALTSYNSDNNQYFYVIGGETNGTVSDQLLRYEPGTNTWTALTSKPTAVSDVQAEVIGNKVYVPGGRLASGAISDVFESYDPRRDKWTALKPLPSKLSGYALAAFEGKLYLFGGWDGQNYHAEVWQYDPGLDKWSAKSPMQTERAFADAAVPERQGRIYVIGGENTSGALTTNESYNPAEDDGSGQSWSTKAPLPAPSSHLAAATTGRTIFVIGGSSGGKQLLQYSVALDSWKPDALPIEPLRDLRAEANIDKLYVIGGQNGSTSSAAAYDYQANYNVFLPISP
jgi:DNA-binding CsgD family transcriptional regulator/N-acetylneuraminic acid mutarotase